MLAWASLLFVCIFGNYHILSWYSWQHFDKNPALAEGRQCVDSSGRVDCRLSHYQSCSFAPSFCFSIWILVRLSAFQKEKTSRWMPVRELGNESNAANKRIISEQGEFLQSRRRYSTTNQLCWWCVTKLLFNVSKDHRHLGLLITSRLMQRSIQDFIIIICL